METTVKTIDQQTNTSLTLNLQPIGVIKNKIKEPFLVADDTGLSMKGSLEEARTDIHALKQEISEIVIQKNMVDLLEGIEKYSHLVILYWAHKVPEKNRSQYMVHPMGRQEIPQVGICCTCSPARPNPVLLCPVLLCGRKDNVLSVSGLDAIDGSPVIDIKPYVKEWYPQKKVLVPDWMKQLVEENNDYDFTR